MSSWFKQRINQNMLEIGLLGVILILSVLINMKSGGYFLSPKNLSDLFTETSILLILTLGMTLVILTGGIDLSIGSIMALSGMAGAITLKNNIALSPLIILFIAVLVGSAAGFVNGWLISRFHILPIIVTLGAMNAYRGATYLLSDGSWVLQQNMSKDFMAIATGKILGVNNLIWIALLLIALSYYFLNYARTGRKIYAVGNSIASAEISGIQTKNVLLLTYTLMGAFAGLGGILYICRYAAAQGETATGYEMNVIASCVLGGVSITGGRGKILGAVIGALLFGLLNNALPLLQISPFWQEALRGSIILVSIVLNAWISRKSSRKSLERRRPIP